MSTYATTTSLDTLMPDTQFNTATTSLVSQLIVQAEDCIKSYLAVRYDISGASFQTAGSIPPILISTAERLTMGYAYQSLSRGGEHAMDRANMFIDQAMMKLRDIADGKIDLYDTAGSTISEDPGGKSVPQSTSVDYHDTFDESDPLDWKIDSDKLDDIEDDKV